MSKYLFYPVKTIIMETLNQKIGGEELVVPLNKHTASELYWWLNYQ